MTMVYKWKRTCEVNFTSHVFMLESLSVSFFNVVGFFYLKWVIKLTESDWVIFILKTSLLRGKIRDNHFDGKILMIVRHGNSPLNLRGN